MRKLKILLATPEAIPFAKTGGLADVTSALAITLAKAGHEVKLTIPKYKMVNSGKLERVNLTQPEITIGNKKEKLGLKKTVWEKVEFLFLENDRYYSRDELYKDSVTGFDYSDNDERYIVFTRGTLEILKDLNWIPDIIHANDWQSALLPAYLNTVYKGDSHFQKTATVFTIHNLAYQGNFPKETFYKLGLSPELFYPYSPFEFWGKVNFMKVGISYADIINTVSETYAVEIQSNAEFGHGLEGVLRQRNADLYGILNGIDYSIWNPETDKLLPYNYSVSDLKGKARNKQELLKKNGWKVRDKTGPLLGMITRLVDQKGLDLLADIIDELLNEAVRLVILGTGEKRYEDMLSVLEKKYPDKLKVHLTFDEPLAHLIEAGCDIYLMPSKYEPCGLNQMFSLKYGTIPVVRQTGGLADTIEDFNPQKKRGTGFVFKNYSSRDFLAAIQRALEIYKNKALWRALMQNAMRQDFSWERQAEKYVELYSRAMQKKS